MVNISHHISHQSLQIIELHQHPDRPHHEVLLSAAGPPPKAFSMTFKEAKRMFLNPVGVKLLVEARNVFFVLKRTI